MNFVKFLRTIFLQNTSGGAASAAYAALTFVYSLGGAICLFKIVIMNLTTSQQNKSPQLLDQSKHVRSFIGKHVSIIKSETSANTLRNIHVSVDVLSTSLPSQQHDLQ